MIKNRKMLSLNLLHDSTEKRHKYDQKLNLLQNVTTVHRIQLLASDLILIKWISESESDSGTRVQ